MSTTGFLNVILIAITTLLTSHTQGFTHGVQSRHIQQTSTEMIVSRIITKPVGSFCHNIIALKATPISSREPKPLNLHHTAIRTRDIETAIKFYSLFGFNVETKFRSGPARAAWITNRDDSSVLPSTDGDGEEGEIVRKGRTDNTACRLELIEVPAYILKEKEGEQKRSINVLANESLLGLNHYAVDVSTYIKSLGKTGYYGLDQFLDHVNSISLKKFGKTLRVAVKPRQQVIGSQVYELAFLYDADGTLFELLRYIKELDQTVDSGWEPWNGLGFVGPGDGSSIESN